MGPPRCKVCDMEMKPLFQTFYCPKDCDKPATFDDEPTPPTPSKFVGVTKSSSPWAFSQGAPPPVPPAPVQGGVFHIPSATHRCPFCQSKDTDPMHSHGWHCWNCGKVWS